MENRHESHNVAKKNYEAAMNDDAGPVKGVQIEKRPYLWRENNPVHPYMDTPCENFVPTPTIHSNDDSKVKRILKYVALGLFIAFMIYALIAIILENSGVFALGKIARRQFF